MTKMIFNLSNLTRLIACICISGLVSCKTVTVKQPPVADKIAKKLILHGDERIDNYHWFNDRENKKVIDYLTKENEYTQSVMAHTRKLQKKLFREMKSRIKKDDSSVPYKLDDNYYYYRYEKGKEYPIHCRKKKSLEAAEEILLDVNKMAKGHTFYHVVGPEVSYNHDIIAYAVDNRGRRLYTIHFKDLKSGKILDDVIPDATGDMAWANDNKTLFYSWQDTTTLRSSRIYRHVLGSDRDVLVYEEKDETFSAYVGKTKTKKFMVIGSYSTLSTEFRLLDANRPEGTFRIFHPREPKHEYYISHGGDRFYILTNDKARNFRLMETPDDDTGKEHWKEVIPHRKDVLLEEVEIFDGNIVMQEKSGGLTQLHIAGRKGENDHYLEFGEPAYSAYIGYNPGYKTKWVRYVYESLTTPESTFDYHMDTKEKVLKKQREVPGDFKPENYKSERIFAVAEDGTKIPISLVYRKGLEKNGANPAIITGYGAYGSSFDPYFSSNRLSILDRGFIYAIAHIRGGSEMGRYWYDDGKVLNKKNTFTDFIASSQYLISENYTSSRHLYCEGGSAGGLLIGAVLNMRPDLYNGVIAGVPFVDTLTTMLDSDIPLTTAEYDEWGNPNEKTYYDYIKSYSPYDNVTAQDYPNLLVTSGLHDSQVQYWEPTKWVAKLRSVKTDDNLLLLKTDMSVGHGGASGRFESLKLYAFEYAFILDLEGITK